MSETQSQQLSRTEQKRQQILEAGRELFFAQGYADTSMDQVTAKSGVSKATLYNHFPSKEKLFEEVVRLNSESVFERLPPLDPNHPDLVEMMTDFFCTVTSILFSTEGSCMCHLAMSEGRRFPENARLIFEMGPGRGLEEATQFLTEISELGRVRISNPRWAAFKLLTLIMPLMDFMKSGMQALQPPDREEIRQTVKFFLKGVDENLQWPPAT